MNRRAAAFRFDSEAEMCAAFIRYIENQSAWRAYPETAGYDIVFHDPSRDLFVGVEAKQSLCADVLAQIAEGLHDSWSSRADVNFRAVLVPEGGTSGVARLARALGVTVIRARDARHVRPPFSDTLPGDGYVASCWVEWPIVRRLTLPGYVPDVVAGSPAPVKLTEWKIAAIKIAVILEKRGFVRTEDFAALRVSMSRWTQCGWIKRRERGVYVAEALPDFRAQHPVNFAEIEAEFEEWSMKLPVLSQPALQGALQI